VLHAQQRAQHVGVEGGGVGLGALRGQRAWLALGAGIVDRDIQPAEARDGTIVQGLDVGLIADIGADEGGLRTEAAQLVGQSRSGVVAAPGDDDGCALAGEGDGSGATDPGQRAGDENDR